MLGYSKYLHPTHLSLWPATLNIDVWRNESVETMAILRYDSMTGVIGGGCIVLRHWMGLHLITIASDHLFTPLMCHFTPASLIGQQRC